MITHADNAGDMVACCCVRVNTYLITCQPETVATVCSQGVCSHQATELSLANAQSKKLDSALL